MPTPALLAVAVLAVSSSAVLIRWADASPVAVAFWRTLGGALILAPAARRSDRPSPRQWGLIVVAGVALGAHFATWLTSLELTSVAASVTLVSTAPLFVAIGLVALGHRLGRWTWAALAVAALGTVIITVGDATSGDGTGVDGTSARALLGDGLALIGAATAAVYLMAGDRLRNSLSTAGYAARTYAVAAVAMLLVIAIGGVGIVGFDGATWLAIGAMILGPQLAGHTVLNHLLGRMGSLSISLALLAEPVGASLLALALLGEVPPVAALIGGPLVIAAVALRLVAADREPARV